MRHDNIISECSNNSRTPSNSNNALHLGKTKCGSKRTNNNVECRHRYPKKQGRMTVFHCSGIQNIKWYKWDGSYECHNVIETMPKHNVYDAFQNVSICCLLRLRWWYNGWNWWMHSCCCNYCNCCFLGCSLLDSCLCSCFRPCY